MVQCWLENEVIGGRAIVNPFVRLNTNFTFAQTIPLVSQILDRETHVLFLGLIILKDNP